MNCRLAFLCVACLLAGCGSEPNYTVIRMQMPGGYTTTTIQRNDSLDACLKAAQRIVAPVRAACPQCDIEFSRCERRLSGQDALLWSDDAMDHYSVNADPMRAFFSGQTSMAKAVCERTAADISRTGRAARCFPPGQPRKS
jgi:hypothetical protein